LPAGLILAFMAKRLTEDEIARQVAALEGWTREGNAIRKQFTLGGFPDAVAFVTRLAFDAEAADHHPDITINYKRVTLSFSTHSEGGLTQKDFDGAKTVDALL
jgi:4a-hydroxytetrahydrobiopterin dehydratase